MKLFLYVPGIIILMLSGCSEDTITLDEVLDRQAEVSGTIPEGSLLRLTGTVFEPTWPGPIPAVYEAMKPGMMRIVAGPEGQEFREGYNGEIAWESMNVDKYYP